ncbi:mediator of RNA polymerase II transcription subunit 15a-like [Syzygium oleosum]|uniref:mediator of RNA polymerase II transcription subunit 15a-like n=1 Tax=Syzygium oleosum TaxID=219896 RepID=UPI0024BB42B5|nr:mediator of RNA polymerase II transcription subunit 15a-like [Syzygium oleosum]
MNPANAFGWAYMNNWHNMGEQFEYWISQFASAVLEGEENKLKKAGQFVAARYASGSLAQQQNLIDQQKQLYPSQTPLPEASTMSFDSSAQRGHSAGGDWQEEAYQKMKSMREAYLPELNEMYQKIFIKIQQHESLPQQPNSEQLEKLKAFKGMLERVIAVLQFDKADIVPSLKEKLVHYEKQIINFINGSRARKVAMQQGQLPAPHMQMQQQQLQTQITQVQSHENQMNLQLQSMNLPGSVASMQQNNMGNWHHNFMSSLSGVSNAQQTMIQQQPAQLQQQVGLQQQANLLQRDMHQRLQASGSLFQQQNVIDQQMQLYPSQTPLSETPTMSIDSSAQMGHSARGDWQEAAYQKM